VRERKDAAALSGPDLEARRRLENGMELMRAKESERAVRLFESILEQYPNTPAVYPASLELGRHYLDTRDQAKAILMFGKLKSLERPGKELAGDEREWFLEALYLTGVAHFQTRRFSDAFPVLRKITSKYSGTVWANQAYYYIGMCHFVQKNWSKTIEALGMVGAFLDPDSPTAQYMEAGRRFYVRIEDRDLPILQRLGKGARVTVKTASGDAEEVDTIPLTTDGVIIGSIPTAIGVPKPGDNTLQLLSGDKIVSTYTDVGTESGDANVPRTNMVKAVSSGSIAFVLGDYESAAVAAYLASPCFLRMIDYDLDVSDRNDEAEAIVISRYKKESESQDVLTRSADRAIEYVTRDQTRVPLIEIGTNTPVRTGKFGGRFMIARGVAGSVPRLDDADLTCEQGDEIVVSYTDTMNIEGPIVRTTTASLPVLGEVDSRPQISQDKVFDPVVLAKKNLVEAQAYLELARIFRSMGLLKGARERVVVGLDRTKEIISIDTEIPLEYIQDAYRLTWELHIACDDFPAAMTVCATFNRLYPDSPIVDQALMGMGRVFMENQNYSQAISMFGQIIGLRMSEAKGEAQFRIGEATELAAEKEYTEAAKAGRKMESSRAARIAGAVPAYKLCAERYPDSPFAPQAIAKVIDYYVETKDFSQAGTLLDQVFVDYPDAPFLDSMYLKWTLVAYQSGDYVKARDKCQQLISEYPDSAHAAKAKEILPRIQAKLASASDGGAGPTETQSN
jgi:TolA-binding protein